MNPVISVALVVALGASALYIFIKEWRQFGRDKAFWSDKKSVAELARYIDEVVVRVEQSATEQAKYREHLEQFRAASGKWHAAVRVCTENPRPTKSEIASARRAAKELTKVCQQGIGAGHEGIDYEKIMAGAYGLLRRIGG